MYNVKADSDSDNTDSLLKNVLLQSMNTNTGIFTTGFSSRNLNLIKNLVLTRISKKIFI